MEGKTFTNAGEIRLQKKSPVGLAMPADQLISEGFLWDTLSPHRTNVCIPPEESSRQATLSNQGPAATASPTVMYTFESSWLHWPILLNLLIRSWDNSEGWSQLQSYLRHHPEDHWYFITAQLSPLPSPAPALTQVWIPRALPRKPPASVSSRVSFPGSPLSSAKRGDRDRFKKKKKTDLTFMASSNQARPH